MHRRTRGPQLTAGAEFKGLRFDWEPVAGATWYELEYKANQDVAFVKKGSNLAASVTSYRFRFPLHLFDWTYARYRLAACNSAGCARSAEVSVSNLRRDAVGYFKAADSASDLGFGERHRHYSRRPELRGSGARRIRTRKRAEQRPRLCVRRRSDGRVV